MKQILLLFFFAQISFAQAQYPQDYFRSPLDVTLVLSGTFAELRSNHFHSGLDIKTQQREGLKVYAIAKGYVSRIKISRYGYGKALYITHPNGYTSVYAHLKKFSPAIEAYVKQQQYEKETFEIELFPNSDELLISTDDVVAFSGNTGSSSAAHLHFEIRDNNERPINPMLFGIDIKDSKAPYVSAIYAYPINETSYVNDSNNKIKLRLIPNKNGDYSTENISAYGDIGFGIVTYDQQDLASNRNGVNNIQSFLNGNKNFEIDFKRFSFDESKHINKLIDYEMFKTKKTRIQKLFLEPNNPLSLYKNIDNKGYINVEDSTASVYKIKIKDFKNNTTWVSIPIKGKTTTKKIEEKLLRKPNQYILSNQANNLDANNISVYIPKNTFYEDTFINFKTSGDTLFLDKDVKPLQKYFTIKYDISGYNNIDKNKLFIARLYGYKKTPSYLSTKLRGDVLTATSKILGTFTLVSDIKNPTVQPINFQKGKWLSKYRYLKIKINDDLSGISNYRATVNGKWILMEYDYKTRILTHDFNDNVITETKNNLKLIVTDNVGNNTIFETTFFRK